MRLIIGWVINALALLALPYVFNSIRVDSFYTALVTALVLGLVNSLIRPILILLTLPINLLTLGLPLRHQRLAVLVRRIVCEGLLRRGFWPAVGAPSFIASSAGPAAVVLGKHPVEHH
jgi:putative membrane protein